MSCIICGHTVAVVKRFSRRHGIRAAINLAQMKLELLSIQGLISLKPGSHMRRDYNL